MKRSRFTETQIVAILKEADSGLAVKDICRKHGISDATYYNWKSKYGGAGLGSQALKRDGARAQPAQTHVCRHGP